MSICSGATAHRLPADPAARLYRADLIADLRRSAGRLRMLFICRDDAIPRPSRRVLALTTLRGLSTAEIALCDFSTSEAQRSRCAQASVQRGGTSRRTQSTRSLCAPNS